jgi:hypothetical protein
MKIFAKGSKGQAMAEMILMLPVLALLILLITWIGGVMITQAYLVQGARYATDLIQYNHYATTPAKVKQAIEGFLGTTAGAAQKHGRKLYRDRLTMRIVKSSGDSRGEEASSFTTFPTPKDSALGAGMQLQHGMELAQKNTIGVELYYKTGVPTLFKAFESIMPGGSNLPQYITVSARSEVISPGAGYVVLGKSLPPASDGGDE